MLSALPAAGPVAKAAYADGSLPPVAVLLQPAGAPTGAEPVALSVIVHPRWQHLLTAAGATPTRATSWKVRKTAALSLLAALSARWHHPASGRVASVKVTGTGLTLTTHPGAAGDVLRDAFTHVGQVSTISGLSAHAAVEDARRLGVPIFRAGDTATLTRISETTDRTVVVTAAAGMPAMLRLEAGPAVTKAVPDTVAAADLHKLTLPTGTRLLLRADAADAVAVARATPAGVQGLHPWQDLFAGRYTATSRGMVNALAPGLGKSAAALSAIRHRHAGAPARVLVLAPTTSRTQWLDEAARFFPQARVWDAGTGGSLSAALAAVVSTDRHADTAGCDIVLTTPDLLARHDVPAQLRWDDLVVDEATFLAQESSIRAQATWAARSRSDRAMVLTGTPTQRRIGELEPLVCFALNCPDLFAALALAEYSAMAPRAADRLGAYLHEHHEAVPAPRPKHQVELVDPHPVDTVVDACVRSRLASLAERNPPTLRRDLEQEVAAARLGYADPGALLASKYPLAGDVRAALPDASGPSLPGAKMTAVHEAVAAAVGAGEKVLVFSDFLAPLDALATDLRADLRIVDVQTVTSRTSAARRELALAAFKAGHVPVLLLSGTGHRGLNLQQAGHVVHLDLPATGSALVQRTARSARLGSVKATVTSVVPVLEGTVEDRLADLVGSRGLDEANREDAHAWLLRLLRPPLRTAA